MNKVKFFLLTVMCCSLLSSCSTAIGDYQDIDKPFDIKNYFNGRVVAWGMLQDYANKVTRRFCVEIEGTWQGSEGVLAEKFYFNDGEVNYRNWQLSKQMDGSYEGQAEDVIGVAVGNHQGFAFQFQYELSLVVEDKTYQVFMDDWMYQLDEFRVMNKTTMKKLGVKVAEVTLFFDKQTQVNKCVASENI